MTNKLSRAENIKNEKKKYLINELKRVFKHIEFMGKDKNIVFCHHKFNYAFYFDKNTINLDKVDIVRKSGKIIVEIHCDNFGISDLLSYYILHLIRKNISIAEIEINMSKKEIEETLKKAIPIEDFKTGG